VLCTGLGRIFAAESNVLGAISVAFGIGVRCDSSVDAVSVDESSVTMFARTDDARTLARVPSYGRAGERKSAKHGHKKLLGLALLGRALDRNVGRGHLRVQRLHPSFVDVMGPTLSRRRERGY
jgi:hypothetical protein